MYSKTSYPESYASDPSPFAPLGAISSFCSADGEKRTMDPKTRKMRDDVHQTWFILLTSNLFSTFF